jgi:hypothetical protein
MNNKQFGGTFPFGGFQAVGLDMEVLIQKAANFDRIVQANERIAAENIRLNGELDSAVNCIEKQDELIANQRELIDLLEDEGSVFIAPSFPEDFEFFNGTALDDEEIQDLVVQAASYDIAEGGFQYITDGNTAVIRMNDGEKIITVVAQDFFESLEDAYEEIGDEQYGWAEFDPAADRECDPDCICRD